MELKILRQDNIATRINIFLSANDVDTAIREFIIEQHPEFSKEFCIDALNPKPMIVIVKKG